MMKELRKLLVVTLCILVSASSSHAGDYEGTLTRIPRAVSRTVARTYDGSVGRMMDFVFAGNGIQPSEETVTRSKGQFRRSIGLYGIVPGIGHSERWLSKFVSIVPYVKAGNTAYDILLFWGAPAVIYAWNTGRAIQTIFTDGSGSRLETLTKAIAIARVLYIYSRFLNGIPKANHLVARLSKILGIMAGSLDFLLMLEAHRERERPTAHG